MIKTNPLPRMPINIIIAMTSARVMMNQIQNSPLTSLEAITRLALVDIVFENSFLIPTAIDKSDVCQQLLIEL